MYAIRSYYEREIFLPGPEEEVYRALVLGCADYARKNGFGKILLGLSGAPTSTTQVVTATLLGNGAAEKPQHVKWQTARGIVAGWFMNVPTSMLLGWLYCFLFSYNFV